jgi:2-polyprenyl-3-methyl-5-hydroxy-6-metoxy-1,4-benzoquinol methylase
MENLGPEEKIFSGIIAVDRRVSSNRGISHPIGLVDRRVTPDRRTSPRFRAVFAVKLKGSSSSKEISTVLGESINLSHSGACLNLERELMHPSVAILSIKFPMLPDFETRIKILWSKSKEGRISYGVHFLDLKEKFPSILKEALSKYESLNSELIPLVNSMRNFLQGIKNKFDEFDKVYPLVQKQIDFIEGNKKETYKKLDNYFGKIWEIAMRCDEKSYNVHRSYFQQMLHPLVEEIVEINRHIYRKPLGYAGDYMVMNYIYDYQKNKYLGNSSYERLINNYTCNIPIASCNIKRKEFFKRKILKAIKTKDNARIMSVGCGPLRELIELLEEGKVRKPLSFKCVDFEKGAIDYVKSQLEKIDSERKRFLYIEYLHQNIINIIKNKEIKEKIKNQDLIYCSGVIDYLRDRIAGRLVRELFQLLNDKGVLIVCNATLENSSHRAYYEMLGEWSMIYRTKEEMLDWMKGIKDVQEISFEEPPGCSKYLFLRITKL